MIPCAFGDGDEDGAQLFTLLPQRLKFLHRHDFALDERADDPKRELLLGPFREIVLLLSLFS